jgi:hypothetical protein
MITIVLLCRNEQLTDDSQIILLKLNSNLGDFRKRTMTLFREHDNLMEHADKMFFFAK